MAKRVKAASRVMRVGWDQHVCGVLFVLKVSLLGETVVKTPPNVLLFLLLACLLRQVR